VEEKKDHFTLPNIVPKSTESHQFNSQAMDFADVEQVEQDAESKRNVNS
jgi:hypothetical protein